MKKRVCFSVALVFVMLVSMTGCGGNPTASSSNVTSSIPAVSNESTDNSESSGATQTGTWTGEVTEFEFMNMSTNWKAIDWGSDPGTTKLTEMTGVKMNCIAPNGDWEQVANAMLAAGDYPEVMHMPANSVYKQYVAAGALRPINKLADQYNHQNVVNGTNVPEDVIKFRTSSDGNIYLVPNWYSEDGFGTMGTAVNLHTGIYEALDSPSLDTMDELYKYLVKVKEANLTTESGVKIWPFAYSHQDAQYIGNITNMYGSKITGQKYYNDETGQVEFILRNPNLIKSLSFLSKCLSEELLDPEVLTFDSTQVYKEHTTQGKYAVVISEFWDLWDAAAILGTDVYKAIAPPQGSDSQAYLGSYHTAGWGGFMVTNNCPEEKLEAIMRFIDFRTSEEGQILNFYGVEGNTMEFKDGKPFLLPEAQQGLADDFSGYTRSSGVRIFDMMNDQKYNWEREQEKEPRRSNRKVAMDYAFDSSILALILVDPISPQGILQAELETNIKAELTKMIMEPDEAKIQEMINTLLSEYERRGLKDLEAEWTKQYNELK